MTAVETRSEWIRPIRSALTDRLRRELELRNREGREFAHEDTVALTDAMFLDAVENSASDLHLTPVSSGIQVRMRVDGAMYDTVLLPPWLGNRIVRHLKTMADLDAVSSFKPQEARRTHAIEGRSLDMRLACVPTICGEKIAIRLLDPGRVVQRISTLGMSTDDLDDIANWLASVSGMFLVTGPTGSGKTTTLYALLHELKALERSIVTIEDPVEYQVDGISQVQVDRRHSLTFAEGIKSMLRMDPDLILVGEIRDAESADAATTAGASGRTVMSTLHSRDAVGAVTSLRNWHVKDHEIATVLEVVVAQRLVRTLCKECRHLEKPTELEARWLRSLNLPVPEVSWHAVGCDACRGIGYGGRTGVFEVWRLDESDYHRILHGADERSLREALAGRGHRPLLSSGLDLVRKGVTSLDEMRVLGTFYVPPPRSEAAEELASKVEAIPAAAMAV